ncbi:MAG: carboxypeptidase-like regulatory domain-containing protein [Patescibacteria group bacterium]|nr:carboxypeptidase-like regulatory domain-containing protein [Patescibacteria group bacterium]
MKRGALIATMVVVMGVLFLAVPAFASNTDGTITGSQKNAWGSKIGWINFGVATGNVHITDSALTGYAWNDLYGWIHLNPSTSGVMNSNGTLSGYAWSENLGWLNFSGVIINAGGVFTGQASGDNFGVVNFDCDNCTVKTDWRPASVRTACNNGVDDDNDGKIDYPADVGCTSSADNNEGNHPGSPQLPGGGGFEPTPPYYMILDNDAVQTSARLVTTTLRCGTAAYAWLSENNNFPGEETSKIICDPNSVYTTGFFNLSDGYGRKTVFVKFCNGVGQCSETLSDDIVYTAAINLPVEPITPPEAPGHPAVTTTPPAEEELSAFEQVKDYLSSLLGKIIPPQFKSPSLPIAKLFTDKWLPQIKKIVARFTTSPQLPPVETIVTRQAPRSMSGKPWELLDPKPTIRFVFAPLPKEFVALAEKLPDIRNTFERVGIKRMADLGKLSTAKINLPGLSQVVGLKPTSSVDLATLAPLKAVPINDLPKNLKQKIPTDIIFTRGANELVDFNVALSLSDTGKAVQKIRTISGKQLELSVRPDHPVSSVLGYLIFKSRDQETASIPMPLAQWFNSLIFAEPVMAYPLEQPVKLEEKLVLQEFEYTDPDKDGIYTASIFAPVPEGEYEIITVMNYEDPDLGTKQVRLITVVDPEGYVYEKVGKNQELRINGAVVALYWLNPETKTYEMWPAGDFQQENPQVTDSRGAYSFLVPEGLYYLSVEAPGYAPHEGKPFEVREGSGVHTNIAMNTKYWWLGIIDWRTLLLIVIGLFLVYNFYKDRQRKPPAGMP